MYYLQILLNEDNADPELLGGIAGICLDYKNMDNNQTKQIKSRKAEDMQNWKKQILMDPVLNGLYDPSISAEEFFTSKLISLPHQQVAALYSKLSSIHFELSHNLQKEVETKSSLLEKSYNELIAYKEQIEDQARATAADAQALEHLTHLRAFNKKYQNVEQSIVLWKNISDCLHFSKAFQNFKVSTNIMKTRMRGYNGNEDTINPFTIARTLKQIIQLSTDYDFTGIKGFQNQRVFISSTKSIIHSMGCKALPKLLLEYASVPTEERLSSQKTLRNIQDWIIALINVGTLKEFVVNYGKSLMRDIPESIKKNMRGDLASLSSNVEKILVPYLEESCKAVIWLEQKLIMARKVDLSNIPNLFVCIWEKLCVTLKQNIISLKNQEARSPSKNRQDSIVWKYPTIYANFSKLCSSIQIFLIETAHFNSYNFGKNKEKLMVTCLLELAVQYHLQKDKYLSETLKSTHKKFISGKEGLEFSEEKEAQRNLQQSLSPVQIMFRDSKCEMIYHSLLTCLCEKLGKLEVETSKKNEGDEKEEVEKKQQQGKLLRRVKKQLKTIVIKYGEQYGIDKVQLQYFKIQ